LQDQALHGNVQSVIETAYGRKLVLDGGLICPDGKVRKVRSVWFISTGATSPRLVTAYPTGGTND
jgi:hypothetical protein